VGRILLIEDDEATADMVEQVLTEFNHVVDTVTNGTEGLEYLMHQHYDLSIIDWGLPGLTGVEICERYRKEGGRTPLLFLTGQQEVSRKVQAFDLGADDYLCKPFSVDELLARVNALLRRPRIQSDTIIISGSLEMNVTARNVTISGEPVSLSSGEFELLSLLMQNPKRIFSTAAIVEKVYSSESDTSEKTVRQRILCLRKKLEQDSHDKSIVNVKGQGYKFDSDGKE
jgi:Response regulators consisting of a CheY-like receiver domain and a winged-helix DNA-binding domain